MRVASPEKALLRVLWDVLCSNGLGSSAPLGDVAKRLEALQQAGVSIYRSDYLSDIERAVESDALLLEQLGLVQINGGEPRELELTPAGELLATNLEFPEWARPAIEGPVDRGLEGA